MVGPEPTPESLIGPLSRSVHGESQPQCSHCQKAADYCAEVIAGLSGRLLAEIRGGPGER